MSLNIPSRRLLQSATSTLSPSSSSHTSARALLAIQHLSISSPVQSSHLPRTQTRNAWFGWGRKNRSEEDDATQEVLDPMVARGKAMAHLKGGRVESESIFSDELEKVREEEDAGADGAAPVVKDSRMSRSREALARAVDPDPRSRVRWQRKMVIRHVAKATNPFSHEPRLAKIRRTEKELQHRSPNMPTSTKKLVHLAHQIAGKTVEDALAQMRYSKKKMAKEIAWHLETARDRAIVERGMGLGKVKAIAPEELAEGQPTDGKENEADVAKAIEAKATEKIDRDAVVVEESDQEPVIAVQAKKAQGGKESPLEIQNKAGKWLKIDDPTKMYIAQAWVGKGPWRGRRLLPRARGRADVIYRPSASISVILKEHKTMVREFKEREERKIRQGPWVHLPDRPITAQRQYYSW